MRLITEGDSDWGRVEPVNSGEGLENPNSRLRSAVKKSDKKECPSNKKNCGYKEGKIRGGKLGRWTRSFSACGKKVNNY